MADLVVPQLGESITEAVIARWLKQVGEPVGADEPLVDLETDKITVQLPSPVAGALREQRFAVGATVKVGDIVGMVEAGAAGKAVPPAAPAPTKAAAPPTPMPTPTPVAAPAASIDKDALLKLTPSQRASAREHGGLPAAAPAARTSAPAREVVVDPRDEVQVMSPLRKRIAERLVQAQQETASLTTFNEVDMTAVMELRARHKDAFEKAHGAEARLHVLLREGVRGGGQGVSGVNAEVAGDRIIYKRHYDFGIAVSTPRGLVVPVLRDCDSLTSPRWRRASRRSARRRRTIKLATRRLRGRHLHDLERGHLRLDDVDADPQPAAGGHPRHAQHRRPADGGRRSGGDPPDDVPRAHVRPPPHRRARGGVASWCASRRRSRRRSGCCCRSEASAASLRESRTVAERLSDDLRRESGCCAARRGVDRWELEVSSCSHVPVVSPPP
jgi:2-oxoglutarate dehydrogenase E2 component (dihydrolipoamide succinyltransferase)